MTERTKMYSRPEGCICEQFAYLPNIVIYPTGSDMNELYEFVSILGGYKND